MTIPCRRRPRVTSLMNFSLFIDGPISGFLTMQFLERMDRTLPFWRTMIHNRGNGRGVPGRSPRVRATDVPQNRQATIERAYELARSDKFVSVAEIISQLAAEHCTNVSHNLHGRTLRRALKKMCDEARR